MGLGFVQFYRQLDSVEDIDKSTVMLGVLTSSLWLVFQYRKYGINATTIYTTSGLVVQLYILNRILLKEKNHI
jgi:hypothetical protein